MIDYIIKRRLVAVAVLFCFYSATLVVKGDVGPVYTLNGGAMMRASVPYDGFAQNFNDQQQTEWCWAASISNIFAYYNHPVSQEKIVRTIYGTDGNFPAMHAYNISQAVNRDWVDDNGVSFHSRLTAAFDAEARVYGITNTFMINELAHNRPLLICNTHHCMVLTAIDYSPQYNGPNVAGLIVFDPWPASEETHYLSWPETIPVIRPGGQCTYVGAMRVW